MLRFSEDALLDFREFVCMIDKKMLLNSPNFNLNGSQRE